MSERSSLARTSGDELAAARDILQGLIATAEAKAASKKASAKETKPSGSVLGSCIWCQASKSKCDGGEGVTCSKCRKANRECVYKEHQQRGRKKSDNSQAALLQKVQNIVIAALGDDTIASNIASGIKKIGQESDEEDDDEGEEAQQQLLKSPEKAKGKRHHIESPSQLSPNSYSEGAASGHPSPSNRTNNSTPANVMFTSSSTLNSSSSTFSGAESSSYHSLPIPLSHLPIPSLLSSSFFSLPEEEGEAANRGGPLEFIAQHKSLSNNTADGLDDQKQDNYDGMTEEQKMLRNLEADQAALFGRFFETGLHNSRLDSDYNIDPLNIGILAMQDVERLFALFFLKLHQFTWQLDPNLHSPVFVRARSTFLLCVVCTVAASYDPYSVHFVDALSKHTKSLALHVYDNGFKSIEIVQAYCIYMHWLPAAPSWALDKSWKLMGQAIRVGTELRLDRRVDSTEVEKIYRAAAASKQTPAQAEIFRRVERNRERTWRLVFCSETALCIHTGRTSGIALDHHILNPTAAEAALMSVDDAKVCALVAVRRITLRAMELAVTLAEDPQKSGQRERFTRDWPSEFDQWAIEWNIHEHTQPFLRRLSNYMKTLLYATALSFKGPTQPTLSLCIESASEMIKSAITWPDDALLYASNIAVVNITYCATILLKLLAVSPSGFSLEDGYKCLGMCEDVGNLMERIANHRKAGLSMAYLHCWRIRHLLKTFPKESMLAWGNNMSPRNPAYPLDAFQCELSSVMDDTLLETMEMDLSGFSSQF